MNLSQNFKKLTCHVDIQDRCVCSKHVLVKHSLKLMIQQSRTLLETLNTISSWPRQQENVGDLLDLPKDQMLLLAIRGRSVELLDCIAHVRRRSMLGFH